MLSENGAAPSQSAALPTTSPALAVTEEPPPAADFDQDIPSLYLIVDRSRYPQVHETLLPRIIAANLCVDVLTSAAPLPSLHAPGAYEAATARLRDPAYPLPGVGDVFIRVTAPDSRLLREAARVRMRLPLCERMLRAVDEERNRATRDADGATIPTLPLPGALDPYAFVYAPFSSAPLPSICRGAVRRAVAAGGGAAASAAAAAAAAGAGRSNDDAPTLTDAELTLLMYSVRGSDGVRVCDDVAALRLLRSTTAASSRPGTAVRMAAWKTRPASP